MMAANWNSTSPPRGSPLIRPLPGELRSVIRSGFIISTVTQCIEELVLNSVDAEATSILVSVNLDTFEIRVEDNGSGIKEADMYRLGLRYSTSKCVTVEDLDNLKCYGYRGEALASIIEMCFGVEFISKDRTGEHCYSLSFNNGKPGKVTKISSNHRATSGISITLKNLMGKFPVRQRRVDPLIEMEDIKTALERILLINPRVSLTFRNEGTRSVILNIRSSPSVLEAFKNIYVTRKHGMANHQNLIEVYFSYNVFFFNAYISRTSHHSKTFQMVYINKRYVNRSKVHRAIHQSLSTALNFGRKGKELAPGKTVGLDKSRANSQELNRASDSYPVFIVDLRCPYNVFDINTDPKKTVVEFREWDTLMTAVDGLIERVKCVINTETSLIVSKKGKKKSGKAAQSGTSKSMTDDDNGESSKTEDIGKTITTHALKRAVHSRVAVRGGVDQETMDVGSDSDDNQPSQPKLKCIYSDGSDEEILDVKELPKSTHKEKVKLDPARKLSLSTVAKKQPYFGMKSLKRKSDVKESTVYGKKSCTTLLPTKASRVVGLQQPSILDNIKSKFSAWRPDGGAVANPLPSLPMAIYPGRASRKRKANEDISDTMSRMSLSLASGDEDEGHGIRDFKLRGGELLKMTARRKIQPGKSRPHGDDDDGFYEEEVGRRGRGVNSQETHATCDTSNSQECLSSEENEEIKGADVYTATQEELNAFMYDYRTKKIEPTEAGLKAALRAKIAFYMERNEAKAQLDQVRDVDIFPDEKTKQRISQTSPTPLPPPQPKFHEGSTLFGAGFLQKLTKKRQSRRQFVPRKSFTPPGPYPQQEQLGGILTASHFNEPERPLTTFELLAMKELAYQPDAPRELRLDMIERTRFIPEDFMKREQCQRWVNDYASLVSQFEPFSPMPDRYREISGPQEKLMSEIGDSNAKDTQEMVLNHAMMGGQDPDEEWWDLNDEYMSWSQEWAKKLVGPGGKRYKPTVPSTSPPNIIPGKQVRRKVFPPTPQKPSSQNKREEGRNGLEEESEIEIGPSGQVPPSPAKNNNEDLGESVYFSPAKEMEIELVESPSYTPPGPYPFTQPNETVGTSAYFQEEKEATTEKETSPPQTMEEKLENWDTWELEVLLDVMGQEWLSTKSEQGVKTFVNLATGERRAEIMGIAGSQKLNPAQAALLNRNINHNWLSNYFPKGSSSFWKQDGENRISKDGNVSLARVGSTILGPEIRQCLRGEMSQGDEVSSKWRDGHLLTADADDGNNNVRVCEYWDRPSCPPELPVPSLTAPELNCWSKRVDLTTCCITRDDLERTTVLAQLDNKFIVTKVNLDSKAQTGAGKSYLILFDQHAVHERIRLETLCKAAYMERENGLKGLSAVEVNPPLLLTFDDTQLSVMKRFAEEFYTHLGVHVKFGLTNTVSVLTVPRCFAERIANEAFTTRNETMCRLVNSLVQDGVSHIIATKSINQGLPRSVFNILCSQACRGAIKFGDTLSIAACQELINNLKGCHVPFQCAHGRPVLVPVMEIKSTNKLLKGIEDARQADAKEKEKENNGWLLDVDAYNMDSSSQESQDGGEPSSSTYF